MIARQIDSPIPMPSGFVVKSGLNIRSISCDPIPVPVSATDITTQSPSLSLRLDAQDPRLISCRHRVDGVRDQIEQHLLQLDPIPSYRRQLPIRLSLDEYPVLLQVAARQSQAIPG